jgi:hypothetical protein
MHKSDIDIDTTTISQLLKGIHDVSEALMSEKKNETRVKQWFDPPRAAYTTCYEADYAWKVRQQGIGSIATIRTIRNMFASAIYNKSEGGLMCPRSQVVAFDSPDMTLRDVGVSDRYPVVFVMHRSDAARAASQSGGIDWAVIQANKIREALGGGSWGHSHWRVGSSNSRPLGQSYKYV